MSTPNPTVSILIPCYNEAKWIDGCLHSVFAFEPIEAGFEVLVIDGLSSDGTREHLEKWQRQQANLWVLDNPGRIVPKAMNLGIQAARGQWIVRLDAHSTYPPNYLRLCLETSQRTGADNVGGVAIARLRSEQPQARLTQALTTHWFGVGNATFRLDATEGPADTVPFGCFRRQVFDQIGLYDERLVRNQDYELNRRLVQAGGRIWLNPAIQVLYRNQDSLRGLFRQAVFTGQWNPWMWYLAPYTFAARHAIPGAFVLTLIGLGLLSLGWGLAGLLAALGLAAYGVVALFAAFQQSQRYGGWMLPILPFLFLAYHVSYGVGTLWGGWLLLIRQSPVQSTPAPWPGAPHYRLKPVAVSTIKSKIGSIKHVETDV